MKAILFAGLLCFSALADLAIQQGATTATATQFTVLAEDDALNVHAEATGVSRFLPGYADVRRHPDSPFKIFSYRFVGLPQNETFTLTVESKDGKVLDRRVFRTANVEAQKVRFAVASCMDDSHAEQAAMWESLLEKKPQLIFLIGDNVYADLLLPRGVGAGEARLFRRYAETRNKLQLFRAKELVPILATWDDHDYGINDGNRSFTSREATTKIFGWFFAQYPQAPNFTEGPGISLEYSAFGHRFFLMDNRSFRTEPKVKEDTQWGEAQEKFLFDAIKKDKTPTWVLNGGQFFGGYHQFESLEKDHPNAFKRFTAALRDSQAPVGLISGDRHLTELMRIPAKETGFETFELTTSSIHSEVYPDGWKKRPNPRQVIGVASSLNYAIVDSTASTGSLKFKTSVYGPKSTLLYEKQFDIRR